MNSAQAVRPEATISYQFVTALVDAIKEDPDAIHDEVVAAAPSVAAVPEKPRICLPETSIKPPSPVGPSALADA